MKFLSLTLSLGFALAAAVFAQTAAPAAGEPPAKIRVACVGDSITAGGYPAILNRLLGDGYTVLNLGVSGATLMKHGDFTYWKLGKLEAAEKFGPQIVTIMLGTNDAKPQNYHQHPDEFLGDYQALIAALKGLSSKPRVYVMLPVPVFGNGGYGINGTVLRQEITPLIVKAAAETQTDTIDQFTPLANSPALFPDNVHPNGDGAEAIARCIYQALTGAPVFACDSELFLDAATVTIKPSGKAPIHFTTDGTEPTAKSPVYQEPLRLTDSATIKAVAIGEQTSPVTQFKVTKAVLLAPVTPGQTAKGLAFDYYENNDAAALAQPEQLKPARSGVADDFQLAAEQPRKEFWGYRWVGLITVPKDGIYTFHTTSDDGSKLWLGPQLVVDNGGQHGAVERIGRIALKAGAHPLTVTFFNSRAGWSLKVEWEGPGVPRQPIPAGVLAHEVPGR